MIRSRKDEATTVSAITSTVTAASPMVVSTKHDNVSTSTLGMTNNTNTVTTMPSPAAFRFQQQRTSSNVGSTSKSTISATPTMKRNNSSLATMGMSKDDNNTSAPSATAVSSFANTASSSVSSSLQYYNNLLQHQMYNLRKGRNKKKSKHHNNDANIWTVQMPRRMLFGTMGIFLLIPVLIFVYKEMHLQSMDEQLLRGNQYSDHSKDGMIVMKKANRNQEYVTWMANFLTNEDIDEGEGDEALDSADINAILDINETIHKEKNDANNGTTGGLDDLFVKNKLEDKDLEHGANKGMKQINDDFDKGEEEMDELEN